jgi:CheY-like chemotaxis protein
MKVLIVEDNPNMRGTIKWLLQSLEAEMQECRDGSEALGAYISFRPDWVLMDIRMQVVDGLTATREITEAFPEARIVILTNYDDALMREAACEAGAFEYLLKDDLLSLYGLLKASPDCASSSSA